MQIPKHDAWPIVQITKHSLVGAYLLPLVAKMELSMQCKLPVKKTLIGIYCRQKLKQIL